MSEPETTNYFASRLKSDGERFLPGVMEGVIALEHNHRYRFASQLVAGKDVLDIASGEGYGSAWLARYARSVVGVDISPESVTHAKARYAAGNLEYRVGSCSAIPLGAATVDAVVSFETIEHLHEHEEMMREVKRVLRPGGVLVISSPDKFEYSDKPRFQNPFHVRELYRSEFSALLSQHFRHFALYGQRVLVGSVIFPELAPTKISFERLGDPDDESSEKLPAPLYLIAIASDGPLAASSGGVLEQPEGEPLPNSGHQQNALATTLIRTIAAPNSQVLADRLTSHWYLERNVDLVSVSDTIDHWQHYGHTEGRSPAKDLVALAQDLLREREQQAWQAHASETERRTTSLETALANAQTTIERERTLTERFAAAGEQAAQERAALEKDLRLQLAALAGVRHELAVELRANVERANEIQSLRATADAQARITDERITALQRQLKDADAEMRAQRERHTREVTQQTERERDLIARIEATDIAARQHLAALALSHSGVLKDIDCAIQAFRASWQWRFTTPLRALARVAGLGTTSLPSVPSPNHEDGPVVGRSNQAIPVDAAISSEPERPFSGTPDVLTTPPNSRPSPMLAAQSLEELMRLSGGAFVACAYATLLGRAPDADGFVYYVDRLVNGQDRLTVLYEIYSSTEAQQFACNVPGLKMAMARQRLLRMPIIRRFIRGGSQAVGDADLVGQLEQIGHQLNDRQRGAQTCPPYAVDPVAIGASNDDKHFAIDRDWYLRTYPDVAASGMLPDEHYSQFGKFDGRFRCRAEVVDHLFSPSQYLERYPDVADAGGDPLEHYLSTGRSEGRLGGRLALTLFDPAWYLRSNPDVAATSIDPLHHYIEYGVAQGRSYTSFRSMESLTPESLVFSQPLVEPEVRLIAFYLPQFHPIPENDRWWGKGFTEWTNVSRSRPLYRDHEQARLPGELGFYDLRLVDVMKRQAELATTHGLYGFCFYVYWFGGHRLLESPIEMLLKHPEIDINFCYCWANENWTRRWDGLDQDVLIGQSHSPEDDIAFITEISKAFNDRRYIRVGGKPMLLVYRPLLFPDIRATTKRWRQWCRDTGIGELHLGFVEAVPEGVDPADYGMDAAVEFPPSSMRTQEITSRIQDVDISFKGQIHNYLFTAKSAQDYIRPPWLHYRGVMPSWDNTPRKMERSISFFGSTPELYGEWLEATVSETKAHLPREHRMVFINAWNEWGEGAYLEPDRRRGYAYLNHTRDVMARHSTPITNDAQLAGRHQRSHDVAVIVHLHYGELLDVVSQYLLPLEGEADFYFSVRDGSFPQMDANIHALFPDAVVVSYPNQGRDVLPFLHVATRIRDFGYKAICKIHSKKSKHRADGDTWRNDVLNKLLGDKTKIGLCLSQIAAGAGVVSPAGHLLEGSNYWGSNAKRVTELALKMGCPVGWTRDFTFPAGTMFWFDPVALQPLFDLRLQRSDFEVENGQLDGTTAHAVERLIGLSARKAGKAITQTIADDEVADGDYPFAASVHKA